MSNLAEAAQAVIERWDCPLWDWEMEGPTADLIHALRLALAAHEAAKPVAWLHKDDPARVVSALTKEGGERDGGAMRSSLANYTIPVYAAPAPEAANVPSDLLAALRTAVDHIDMGALELSHCKDWAQIKEALAAPAPEATPLKERPDFIAGYDAGLIDGRACERRDRAEATPAQAQQSTEPTDAELLALWAKHEKHWKFEQNVLRFSRALLEAKPESQQPEPAAWINWSALTGEPRLGWQCESEIASEPLYKKAKP